LVSAASSPETYQEVQHRAAQLPEPRATVPLIQTVWTRRWVFTATVVCVLAAAAAYLAFATRIYTSKAKIYVEQYGPRVMGEQGYTARSDNYLHTQAEVIRSLPILQTALEKVHYREMKTFGDVAGDPVVWLWRHSDFRVDVGKKDDIIAVSMDSPYPEEAAAFVNAVVDGYVGFQSKHKRTTGADMVKILEKQKRDLEVELDSRLQEMLKFKRANDTLSFREDKSNVIVERLATLSASLTSAEMNTLEIRTQANQLKAVLGDPAAVTAYVQSRQMKEKDWGDREYDEIRNRLQQYVVALNGALRVVGENSQSPKVLQANIDLLTKQKAEKERAMAEATFADISRQLAAAEEKERQLRASFESQQKLAMELNAKAADYARLEAELDRVRKQYDLIDSRIKEINVNSEDAGVLNVQVLEPARAEERPSSPKKSLVGAVALLAGVLLGTGAALARDWMDRRLRTADETETVLGMPVVVSVPRMARKLSVVRRGRQVEHEPMSETSEAYRTLRTAIHLASGGAHKSVLLTSPTPGDGKSTTASNLAIAMAAAGHRTVLVDADLRRPVQHKVFEVDGSAGLADVLAGRRGLKDVLRRTTTQGLFVLPCGTIPANPAEMIEGRGFRQVIEALKGSFDRVIIDSPPVMVVADARVIASAADATLLVLRMNKSDRKLAALALDVLRRGGANVLGWVANDMFQAGEAYGGGYGYYGGDRDDGAKDDVVEQRAAPASAATQLPPASGRPVLVPSAQGINEIVATRDAT
jgi:capsular exopolysaccharide synthesis family protein